MVSFDISQLGLRYTSIREGKRWGGGGGGQAMRAVCVLVYWHVCVCVWGGGGGEGGGGGREAGREGTPNHQVEEGERGRG